jgi:SAGA-associated factor 29
VTATMESSEAPDPELVDVLRNVAREGAELSSLVAELNNAFDSMYVSQRKQQYSAINAKYTTVMSRIDKVIRQSQASLSAIEHKPSTSVNDANSSPSAAKIKQPQQQLYKEPEEQPLRIHRAHHMFEIFISREMPLNEMPYPPLCGSIPADPNERISIDAYVAAKMEGDDYILCYVAGFDGDDYMIVDADSDDPRPAKKSFDELIQLPTSLPSTKTSRAEYPVGSKVLSLWPTSDEDWTSAFYPATVIHVPSKHGRGYGLKFEDDHYDWIDVQENFVIANPEK